MSFVNQRHVTEENLNQAITRVINAYAQLPLQRVWGSGKSASADGMKEGGRARLEEDEDA